jgi:uncharacterized membrane protein YhaH (DUF805 family)
MEWYIGRNGQAFGPVIFGDLARAARQGQLTKEDFVWRAGMDAWAPASSVPELWIPSDREHGPRAKRAGRLPATLKQLFVPRGRTNRAFFWGALMSALAATFSAANVLTIIVPTTAPLAWPAATVGFFYIFSSLVIGRLHDHNRGGWLAIFYVVPVLLALAIFSFEPANDLLSSTGPIARACVFIVVVAMVVHLGMMRGTVGSNRFGADLAADAHPEDHFSESRMETLFMPGPSKAVAVLGSIWATLRWLAEIIGPGRLVSVMRRTEERHWEGIKRNLELAERMGWHQVTRFHGKGAIDPRLRSPTIGSVFAEVIVGMLVTAVITGCFGLVLAAVFNPEVRRIHAYNAAYAYVGVAVLATAVCAVLIVMRIRKARSH